MTKLRPMVVAASAGAALALSGSAKVYHTVVKHIAARNFERVNEGNYEPLLASCAPNIHHRFGGRHALGGERHDQEALRRWFERLGRVGPDLTLVIRDIWVKGGPWNTYVIIRWDNDEQLPDGSPYSNHGVHVVQMRWLRIVDIDANEDSQAVAESMPVRAAAGIEEALAPPIVS
jgi:ketosteroid isomerase-like protein